jgi:hypothetical protein
VKPDAFDAAYAEKREAVGVLQPAELALDGGAATVEAAPFVMSIATVAGEKPRAVTASSREATCIDSWLRAVSTCHASGSPVTAQTAA